MRAVVLLAEAVEDLDQARDFYEEREPGVGEYCLTSLLADIESLALFHGVHRPQHGCHRMLASRFPFGTDEGRTLLQAALASAVVIEVTQTELRVTLAAQGSPHRTRAIAALCDHLNQTKTVFPGCRLRLHSAVREAS